MTVELTTFGYKAGAPGRADLVFDVRSLPNPFYDPELRPLTGRDPAIARYFAAQERTEAELRIRSSLHDELRRARERGDDRIRSPSAARAANIVRCTSRNAWRKNCAPPACRSSSSTAI